MNRLLIGALSCRAYEERRRRCMHTWVPEALELGIEVLFLIGGEVGMARLEGHNLYLPCADDYQSLPQKVRLFYLWALQYRHFDYIFKCDDDTYVRADRLAYYETANRDYIGSEWTPGVGYGSGGAGYWLSRRAVAVVGEGLKDFPHGDEDVLVGRCLKAAGIPFHSDQRFIAFGNADLRPRPGNDIVTTHGCDMPWKTHRTEFMGERPVVFCQPMGRLGNNMFQVAAVIGFAERNGTHDARFAPEMFGDYRHSVFHRLQYGEIPDEYVTAGDAPDFSYNGQIPSWPACNVAFSGYFQSEKYFEHCSELIRKTFAMSDATRTHLTSRNRDVLSAKPVGIHVRRGDYLAKPGLHPVQPANYYLNALEYLSNRVTVTNALCFSDDPEWCIENLARVDRRIHVVRGQTDYLDLALMTLCTHYVLSNSSFSWWGAWLGENPSKIVIVPDRHCGHEFVGYNECDLIPPGWIRIGSVSGESEIHRHGYWFTTERHQHHAHDVGLCHGLCEFFKAEGGSVADFGCGPGDYVQALRREGVRCDGFDGNPRTELFTDGACKVVDLAAPAQLPAIYDWVLSLEVGEHIPPEFESIFIDNLHRHNSRGIVLSWAVLGQGGHGHFNERSNAYVKTIFSQLGYYQDVVTERRLRASVTNCNWFRNTVMVFRRHCRSVDASISTAEIRLLVERDDPVILELGANDGTDSARLLSEFSGITLHCFEPDPRPLSRFQVRDPRCTLHQVAIAAVDGVVELHMSGGLPPDGRMKDWDLSSSIRRPTGHLTAHPWCTFSEISRVFGRSLDSWYGEHPEIVMIDFLWADLQGAELDLILGGRETLRNHVRYLYTEFYDSPMYDGQINRQQIMDMLPDFDCFGIYEGYNMLLQNRRLCVG